MYSAKSHNELTYLCKLIHESIQLPVYCKSGDFEYVDVTSINDQSRSLYREQLEHICSLQPNAQEFTLPIVHTTPYWDQFILIPVHRNKDRIGTIIIGPVTTQALSEMVVGNILNDNNVPYKQQATWLQYLCCLPFVNRSRLYHISVMTYLLANGVALDIADVLEYNFRHEQRFLYEDNPELTLSNRRESSLFHSDRDHETRMLRTISNGDKAALLSMMINLPFEGAGVLSKRSQLRNIKNLAISGITLATRAAMDGGLHTELAYTISDHHIQHIEELKDARAVDIALMDAFLDFTERVSISKMSSSSRPIAACKAYIFNHMYEDIPLRKLAELTRLNSNYLSHLFRKETSMTISQYIQKERIEEAKRLLELTDEPLSTIASKLNYYDQTHFNKLFKKHANLTPKQYRNRYTADKQEYK
ncbi:helix-turn-helix domain-containing protein [Paenibacillus sp. YIM B09110]|uniref:helix-turn-helix domain-containing protein n=1 Tax=Paenibacillus sp. YIM B09110 TaxID=3126102 RepID=UPI00301CC468